MNGSTLTRSQMIAAFRASARRPRVYGDADAEHFLVDEVVNAARRQHADVNDLEAQLDAFVFDSGGERGAVIDPWRRIGNVLRRLVGADPVDRYDMYYVPRSVFDR